MASIGTIDPPWRADAPPTLQLAAIARPRRSREIIVFHRKPPKQEHAELIDRLLNADPTERKKVIFDALQAGEIQGHEVDPVLGLVVRLERAAGPRPAPDRTTARSPVA
jgi:hypothetical protein